MSGADLTSIALHIARRGDNMAMLPVIEKELLHYEILSALDRARLLDSLTFQGGTCLRLCYGAVRFSEDLDFAGGFDFDFSSISAIKSAIEQALSSRYDIEPIVTEVQERTDESGVTVKKWKIKVITARERPDIPMQRISIEVASIPAHTRAAVPLRLNYEELPSSLENVYLWAETLEEICADKLKAFLTASYIRYRDLWDMNWILGRGGLDLSVLPGLFGQKLADYGAERAAEHNLQRIDEIPAIVESPEFMSQMRRFIPAPVLEDTLERPVFCAAMASTLVDLYRQVLR